MAASLRVKAVTGVEMLWHNDWYDGPLEGLARYDGREYYFRVPDEDWLEQRPRQFVLIELTPAELEREHTAHRDFERLVGTRYCAHLPEHERVQRQPENWPEYYRLYPDEGLERGYVDRAAFAVFTFE